MSCFPQRSGGSRVSGRSYEMSWMHMIQPYVKNLGVFIDPSSGHPSVDWQTNTDILSNYSYAPSIRSQGYDATTLTVEPFGVALWEGIGGFYGPETGSYKQQVASYGEGQIARPHRHRPPVRPYDLRLGRLAEGDLLPGPAPHQGGGHQASQRRDRAAGDHQLRLRGRARQGAEARLLLGDPPRLTTHFGSPARDVFWHFWPYE